MAAHADKPSVIPEDLKAVHVLNRLSLGPRPGDVDRVRRIGVQRYIREQLDSRSIPEPEPLVREIDALQTLKMNPVELFRKYQLPLAQARKNSKNAPGSKNQGAPAGVDKSALAQARMRSRIVLEEAVRARMLRAIDGPRQLQEVMADFWFNHFNVFAGKGLDHLWVGAYEQQAIRPHALGRFRDLLGATAKHPAMLFYLDNWQNTAPGSPGARGKQEGINENYARELMELHTLGVDGGYTQRDVIALAGILTGWGLPRPGMRRRSEIVMHRRRRFHAVVLPPPVQWTGDGFFFDSRRHDFSDKVLLGRTIKGAGIAEGEQALDMLARSGATAHHISWQLAQYFVADQPPESLVKRIAARFLDSDGDIRAVLTAMFESSEFWADSNFGAKFKTPYQYVISAIRASGTRVRNTNALVGVLMQLGMPLYGCQTPDGYKNTQEAWLSPDGMMRRLSFATALAARRIPLEEPRLTADAGAKPVAAAPLPTASAARPEPIDAGVLLATIGGHLSKGTAAALEATPQPLRGAIVLGSPEFMRR